MYSRRDPGLGFSGAISLLPEGGQGTTYFGNTFKKKVLVTTEADVLEGPSLYRKPTKRHVSFHLDESESYRLLSLMRRS
jgi:hypothetical protein